MKVVRAAMSTQDKHFYEFGEFRLDTDERVLMRGSQPIALTPKAYETLLVLVENSGRTMQKDELMARIWPDSIVEEANLTFNISQLRKALGDDSKESLYIQTIARRGYRFVARVTLHAVEPVEPIIERHSHASLVIEREAETLTVKEEAIVVQGAGPGDQPRHSIVAATPNASEATLLIAKKTLLVRRAVVIALLIVGLSAGGSFVLRRKSQPAIASVKSMAVLPFRILNAQSSDEYLGIGITDVLITRLSNLQQLVVRPTSSVLPFVGSARDAIAAGQELGVDTVLEGSIQQYEDRVRVTVRLLRVSDSAPLWTLQCDDKCTDVFTLEDTVSEQVTQALALKLSADEQKRLMKRYTENSAAYQEYLQGRYYTLQFQRETFHQAITHFNRAIELDPNYALAYAGLADAYCTRAGVFEKTREALAKAKELAQKAIALDNTLAEAHAALGHAKIHMWDASAEQEFQTALALNPNLATTLMWYSEYFHTYNPAGALPLLERAKQLDPTSVAPQGFIVYTYLLMRQPEAALREAQATMRLHPEVSPQRGSLALIYEMQGKYNEALDELEPVKDTPPFDSLRAYILARMGKRRQAERLLVKLLPRQNQIPETAFSLAIIYTGLGNKDQAFLWLNKAYDEQDSALGTIRYEPVLDPLRDDPRFLDLLQRIGL